MPESSTGRPRWSTSKTRLAAVVAVVILAAIGVSVRLIRQTDATLSTPQGDRLRYCYFPSARADWTSLVQHGYIFGLDNLVLSGRAARVTVTKVTMINPTGGIRLTNVQLVPGGGVGTMPAALGLYVPTPTIKAMTRTLPAKLTVTSRPADYLQPTYDSTTWQIAATITAPASAVKAGFDGLTVTYLTGSTTRTLKTADTVEIGPRSSPCPS